MPPVVGLGGGERTGGVVEAPKPEQAFRVRQDPAGARVLHDGGPAAREVAERAVAHPRGLESDEGRLRAAPLATGSADVRAIVVRGRAHVPGLPKSPALGLHQPAVLLVVFGEAQGQLELDGRPGGEVDVLQERDPLLVTVGDAVELEVPAPPVGDGGVGGGAAGRDRRPLGQEHRGRCVQPPKTAVREARRRRAHGLANREVQVVGRHADRARRHPDLQQPRIGVDQRRAPEPPHHRGRKHVPEIDEQVGLRGRLEVKDPRS